MSDVPLLRVVAGGEPTADELAAIVVALTTLARPGRSAVPLSRWVDRSGALRHPLPHGPGAWRASARMAGVRSG